MHRTAHCVGIIACVVFVLSGCATTNNDAMHTGPETMSLLGEPLHPMPLPDDVRSTYETNLAAAQARYDAAPEDRDAIIWYGRRLAYLGRYREAIDVFSRGLSLYPDDPELLRHRGHRFLTLRRFNDAITDLQCAADQCDDFEDRIEPDGLPNARNMPRSSLKTNIYYHLALARTFTGDHDRAADAWQSCLAHARNDDMDVAARYWLYLMRKRLGDEAAAAHLLESVRPEMDIIENHDYHRLLLLYKGMAPIRLPAPDDDDAIAGATFGYGMAMFHMHRGDEVTMQRWFEAVLEGGAWPAFGYIACEVEVARRSGRAE